MRFRQQISTKSSQNQLFRKTMAKTNLELKYGILVTSTVDRPVRKRRLVTAAFGRGLFSVYLHTQQTTLPTIVYIALFRKQIFSTPYL